MKLPLKGNRCYCRSCDKYFSRISVFDKHRTGEFGKDRRCMTDDEMVAKGMHTDALGVWRGKKREDDQ